MSESIVIANSTIRQQNQSLRKYAECRSHDEAGAEIGDSGMTRDMKLYELRMLVLGYMQVEDKEKAAEAFMKWQAALKGVD